MQQYGDSVAGKKIQLIVKDDASIPDLSKRMAQELIISDHVSVMGVGLTPNALAIAPLSREAKIPTVLMISGTSTVTEASPYIVRASFTLGQQSGIIAEWAVKNGADEPLSSIPISHLERSQRACSWTDLRMAADKSWKSSRCR
jgi:branched-chain amino acid transport system substrate-binding protein